MSSYVQHLLARIRSASEAGTGLSLLLGDVIVLDAELFRLQQGLADMRRVYEFTRGQVEELTANGVSIAKAADKAYRQGYTDGRDDERAAVVAWLHEEAEASAQTFTLQSGEWANRIDGLANCIERGEHRREEKPGAIVDVPRACE